MFCPLVTLYMYNNVNGHSSKRILSYDAVLEECFKTGMSSNLLIPYLGKKFSVLLIGRLKHPSMVLNKLGEFRRFRVICFCFSFV